MISTLIAFIRRHWVLAVIGLAVVVFGGFFVFGNNHTAPALAVAKRAAIAEEVVLTGKTKPARSAELAFESSGRIASVTSPVGTWVSAGAVIVALDSGELKTDLAEAEANLAFSKAALANGEVGLDTSVQELKDSIRNAYAAADNAIRNRVDRIFSSPQSAYPQINFVTTYEYEAQLEEGRVIAEGILDRWYAALGALSSAADAGTTASTMRADFDTLQGFLDKVALVINQSISSSLAEDWRLNISGARSDVHAALGDLSTALDTYRRSPGDDAAKKADAAAAEARVESVKAKLAKTMLRAPFAGIISRQDATVGEFASAGSPLVALISAANLEIEANVPEISIGKLRRGNRAAITIDAFPGETFGGSVVRIDPAETLIDGIVNFKITVALDKNDARLKSGLTANLSIETMKKEDVLAIPQFMIQKDAEGAFVWKRVGEATERAPVRVGLFGREGLAEILEGLNEGDMVAAAAIAND